MVSLARINSLDFPECLVELEQIVRSATVSVTFWGSRVVTAMNSADSVRLDHIARKIVRVANKTAILDALSPEQRIAGVEIIEKLRKLYVASDKQLEKANFLTRFFCWFRESCFSAYPYSDELISNVYSQGRTTRYYTETPEEAEHWFCSYAQSQFVDQFETSLQEYQKHNAFKEMVYIPYIRVIAKKKSIQELSSNLA